MMEGLNIQEMTIEDAFFDSIIKNDLDTATLLASHNDLDVNSTNSAYKTGLYLAIENENIPMVQMLLNFGADINKASYCGTNCYYETPIVTAARMERQDLVELFLEHKCELEVAGMKEGKTALQWAATYGDITMASLLLDRGSDLNWVGPFFHSALHYAALADQADTVKWLLEKGAEITINGDGRTPLHIGAVRGNLAIVKHLNKHRCELDTIDKFNFTPFGLACLRGHLSIVKYMMENASVGTALNFDDGLLRSCECGHLSIIELLLEKNADVNALNAVGESPLSIASRGHYVSVQLLLKHGAKINIVDKRGYTPLQHAVLREQIDISTTLIRHGSYLQTCSDRADSPLQMSMLVANARLVKCLLEAGCDLNKEPWFSPHMVTEKLQELDFKLPIRFHREATSTKEIWNWVAEKVQRPNSLLEASRIAIRNQMIIGTQGRSILQPMDSLPLPNQLKKFLGLVDDLWG